MSWRPTRRQFLAGVLGVAGATSMGAHSTLQQSGESSTIGGATDAQDRVPVYDLLTILAGEERELGGTETYHGIDWREGGTLVWPDGATFQFTEMP